MGVSSVLDEPKILLIMAPSGAAAYGASAAFILIDVNFMLAGGLRTPAESNSFNFTGGA